jgi:hypothetical protein
VSDRREQPVGLELPSLAGVDVTQSHAGDAVFTEHLVDDGIGDPLDLVVCMRAVEHDLRGAELVAPVHDRDLRRETCQEGRLLHRRVTTADDHHVLVGEEGSVAGGAI